MKRLTGFMVLLFLATCLPAVAQTRPVPRPRPAPTERVFISVNGAFQAGSNDFGESATFRENAEDGRFSLDYTVKSGPVFAVSGGALVWRNVGVGLGIARFSQTTPTALSATIPHPFFFNRARTLSAEIGGLKRSELAVHIQAAAVLPISRRIGVTVFGGPSFFRVQQGLVSDFDYAESYPYDSATFSRGITSTSSGSKIGFNLGGDVAYFFTPQVGLGFGAQFAQATVRLPSARGASVDLGAGGLQAGGGLRLRF